MNTGHRDDDQQGSGSSGEVGREAFNAEEFVAPGAPIVRSSTPRPLTFGPIASSSNQLQAIQEVGHETMPVFPKEAPSAPPLPEESGEDRQQEEEAVPTLEKTPLPGRAEASEEVSAEFLWLFEYGLEMDLSALNSAERPGGFALLYGPAVLKGFEITFDVISSRAGQVAASIVPSRKREAEVWGVLYRISRRLTEQIDNEPALLDKIHSAVPPDGLFERFPVTVHEAYRGREITCITYIASATAHNQFHLLPRDRQVVDTAYVKRLLEIAKKQKLPEDYLHELAILTTSHEEIQHATPGTAVEQNTEPLPAIIDEKLALAVTKAVPETSHGIGMVIYALYLVLSLVIVFALVVLEGWGIVSNLFPASFSPLGIPWFVLFYGLVGGYLSCIVSVGRHRSINPPNFVLITWFTRPFIGAVLAVLAYLLLNSGLFVLSGSPGQHNTIFSLLAVLAGSCEGWLFYKRT